MFIDRKINGALIQDLAPREGVGCMCVDEQQKEEEMEGEHERKERIRQMRKRKRQASVCLQVTEMGGCCWGSRCVNNLPNYSLFPLSASQKRLLRVDKQASNGT